MTAMHQESYREESVTFQGAAAALGGTLVTPAGSTTRGCVLILAGSGPTDRDGNAGKIQANIYRDLAHVLGGQGFMTLRYDKRGIGESQGDYFAAGFWDLVDDATTAVEFLRQRAATLPIILLGHSEGCIIAAAVNARQPIQGIVWLAGPCESLSVTLARQQERGLEDLGKMPGLMGALIRALHLPESQRRQAKVVMDQIMASDLPSLRIRGAKVNAKWIREQHAYDVTQDLPKVHCPTLAIAGSGDVQVIPEHARSVAETVGGPAEWHIIPNMTHVLRRTTQPINTITLMKVYKQLFKEPTDAELLGVMRAWLDAHFPQTGNPKQ